MALGMLVEEVTGQPLDRYLRRTLFRPLGMTDTGFRPEEALLPRIAPTEMDTLYRDTHVHGQVHDENAHAMGGVAGHAGLFSSARDLAVFAQLLLDGGWAAPRTAPSGPYRLARRLSPDVLRDFLTAGGPGARGAGWDLRPAFAGRGETGYSERAFGHTGFTGTSILVDPEHDLFVVLLTSRVNPTRAEDGHLRLRRQVHRAVARALELDR
jgi:CubicO group peptidase (beta-lactamase class C family)